MAIYTPFTINDFLDAKALNTRFQQLSDALAAMENYPPGSIMYRVATPDGWLLCDGSAVSRAAYAALFAVIGTAYGVGDGTTTFNLPDMRGRTAIGAGQGVGLTNRVLGTMLGEENHQLTITEMPSHTHTEPFIPTSQNIGAGSGFLSLNQGNPESLPAGGNGAHNNMQPSLALNAIIKA